MSLLLPLLIPIFFPSILFFPLVLCIIFRYDYRFWSQEYRTIIVFLHRLSPSSQVATFSLSGKQESGLREHTQFCAYVYVKMSDLMTFEMEEAAHILKMRILSKMLLGKNLPSASSRPGRLLRQTDTKPPTLPRPECFPFQAPLMAPNRKQTNKMPLLVDGDLFVASGHVPLPAS